MRAEGDVPLFLTQAEHSVVFIDSSQAGLTSELWRHDDAVGERKSPETE